MPFWNFFDLKAYIIMACMMGGGLGLRADGEFNIMTKDSYKPRIPDLMEAVFDVCYLTFDLFAGILFFAFSKGNVLFILYGILTLTLCCGDAFHLVPRVVEQ